MKKIVCLLITIFALSSAANAQQFGVRFGGLLDPGGNVLGSFGAQVVFTDLLGEYTDLRLIAGSDFGFGVIQIQAMLMFRSPLNQDGDFFAYYGPGVLLFIIAKNNQSGLAVGLLGRAGLEYQLSSTFSIFGDLGAGYVLQNGPGFAFADLAIGINIKLGRR
jgi:hypothetical protein